MSKERPLSAIEATRKILAEQSKESQASNVETKRQTTADAIDEVETGVEQGAHDDSDEDSQTKRNRNADTYKSGSSVVAEEDEKDYDNEDEDLDEDLFEEDEDSDDNDDDEEEDLDEEDYEEYRFDDDDEEVEDEVDGPERDRETFDTIRRSADQIGQMNEEDEMTDGEDGEDEEDDNDDEPIREKMKEMKSSKHYKKQMKEDIDAIFGAGDNTLSEETKNKAAVIFEQSVYAKAGEIAEELQAHYHEKLYDSRQRLQEKFENKLQDLEEKIDSYLGYVVQEWMQENELAIDTGVRSEITEQFIEGMVNLCRENYIDVPEDRYDLLGELQEEVSESKDKLNNVLEENANLTKENNKLRADLVLDEVSRGLSLTKKNKLKNLAESVEFDDLDSYKEKLEALKESYLVTGKETVSVASDDSEPSEVLTEENEVDTSGNDLISQTVRFGKRSIKK